jgi:hypothetical protein
MTEKASSRDWVWDSIFISNDSKKQGCDETFRHCVQCGVNRWPKIGDWQAFLKQRLWFGNMWFCDILYESIAKG